MTIESDFLELMTQTVTIAPLTGHNDFAEPAYGTAVSHRARVVGKIRRVLNAEGREVISSQQVYIYGAPDISTQAQITMPDGTTPQILRVERYPDENGDHHEVVYT
jgi:hypothetical protein